MYEQMNVWRFIYLPQTWGQLCGLHLHFSHEVKMDNEDFQCLKTCEYRGYHTFSDPATHTDDGNEHAYIINMWVETHKANKHTVETREHFLKHTLNSRGKLALCCQLINIGANPSFRIVSFYNMPGPLIPWMQSCVVGGSTDNRIYLWADCLLKIALYLWPTGGRQDRTANRP